jgi:hypothetical protein
MINRTDQSHSLGKIRQDTTDISFALGSYAARLIRKYAFKRNLEKVKKGSYYRNTVMDSLSLSLSPSRNAGHLKCPTKNGSYTHKPKLYVTSLLGHG